MRVRLLQWVCCPSCGRELDIEACLCEGAEIMEGALCCSSGHTYPIIGGIPRLLDGWAMGELPHRYPAFFQSYPRLRDGIEATGDPLRSDPGQRTQERFGYEWTCFSDYACNNFSQFIKPLPQNFFDGKLGLDAGCGAGRHALEAAARGGEVIAVDLSRAVEAAYRNCSGVEKVHVIQADIHRLPLKPSAFDFIYSLGVLQHLPEPEQGFHSLTRHLTRDGTIAVWVYAHALRKVMLESLRFVSQRMSSENVRRMAFFCNLLDYGVVVNGYRMMRSFRAGKHLARRFPARIREYAEHGYYTAYVDWYDRLAAPITNYYKEKEVQDWLSRSILCETALEKVEDSWWWLYGKRS